jgi:predicted nucleic acid-binding protein
LKLIDANIFIYARGQAHPYRDSCRRLLAAVNAGRQVANTDTEVIQEVMYVYWYRRREDVGLRYADTLLRLFRNAFAVDHGILLEARSVLGAHRRLDPRDAIHAAVVMKHGLEGIISTDRGFDAIPGITRFDPMNL